MGSMTVLNRPGILTERDLTLLSVQLEALTGYDSIPTIEKCYTLNEAGTKWFCIVPGCHHGANNPARMWLHVHFGSHGFSFGFDIDELHDALDYRPLIERAIAQNDADHVRRIKEWAESRPKQRQRQRR